MKNLPEPAITCYDDLYLATFIVEAAEELKTRGWIVSVSVVAPHSKSVAKRITIQNEDSKGRSIADDIGAVIPGNQRD